MSKKSDDPVLEVSDDQIATFDFERECIKTYYECTEPEQKVKALTLLKSLQPPKKAVKADTAKDNRSSVERAQDNLRKK